MGSCASDQGVHEFGGPLSGPRLGYDKVTGIRYVVWLNGNNGEEPEFLDGWDGHGH